MTALYYLTHRGCQIIVNDPGIIASSVEVCWNFVLIHLSHMSIEADEYFLYSK